MKRRMKFIQMAQISGTCTGGRPYTVKTYCWLNLKILSNLVALKLTSLKWKN